MTRHHDPEQLERERNRLIAEIEDVFNRVTREGGVSWSEADVIDDFGTMEELREARSRDTDRHWTDLLDDPKWTCENMYGGFSFLDPIGFRYYLPVAMINILRSDDPHSTLAFHLTLPPPGNDLRSHTKAQWSELNDAQRRCIREFLRYMIEFSQSRDDEVAADTWREALMSAWINAS
jgi:hypothetical protein